ncbi:MAG: hypothetical protein IIZ36_01550, partial [Ruminococcus sp.]|nr:hypothetical protein [Ruminococcus sp.]
ESNTLTLTDLNRPELSLSTNMMGDDFKLRIIGDCALDVVYIWGDMYGGSLDIEGDGVLTVNEAQKSDYALVMNAEGSNAKLNFGSDVKVNLYGQKAPCVISYSGYGDLETGITFENGENIPFNAGKESSIENDIVNTIEYEDLGSTWTTRYGILFNCDTETDEDVFYAGFYYDEDYYSGQALYTISRYKFLKKYDAIIKDQSFGGYGQLSVPADELEDSGYSVVTEKAKVQRLYTNDYMEKYSRGLEADRLIKDSDPDSIYCVNYSWTIDREHPDGYYIRRLIWDEDIEFYVPDPDFGDIFGSESYNADEFPDSGYSYLLDDDGDRVTVRYLDEYTGIDHYGEEAPLVLNDKTPGVKYIAELYTNYETGEETYLVTPIVYNEKRGYYFEGDNGEWLTPEEFDNSDYYFIYEDQPVKCVVKHNGDVTLSNLKLYQDSNGAQFGVDNHDLVYNIDYDKSEEIFGKTYYDIRLQNGMVKTVPASSTTKEKESKNDNNTIKL